MTAVYPRRTDTRFRGVIYGFDLLDHHTGQKVCDDYVGKTRQRGRKRELQHRSDKPWEDLIVGQSHVLWEGICDEDELDDRERQFIRERRPRMNDKDNRWNPERIDYDEQVRQRHERDDREHRAQWAPLEQRQRDSLLDWDETPPAPKAAVRVPWSSRRKHLTWLVVTWLVLSLAGWVTVAVRSEHTQVTAYGTPVAALLLTVWVWAGVPVRRRGRRKSMTRIRRRLQIKRRVRR